jgi:DNA invertase Pin-like site-specific DNA recombinase
MRGFQGNSPGNGVTNFSPILLQLSHFVTPRSNTTEAFWIGSANRRLTQRADYRILLRTSRLKCGRIYQEKASGAKPDRPELMKLLDNARKVDVVIVWKLDRLARSIRQLLDTTALLNERGVELYSLTENINTTTPSGKLTFHIFAALADDAERAIMQSHTAEMAVWPAVS